MQNRVVWKFNEIQLSRNFNIRARFKNDAAFAVFGTNYERAKRKNQIIFSNCNEKMLFDEFMPAYDFDEKHETIVRASAETVYAALNWFDFNDSAVIRWLFRLRGLAAKNSCDAIAQILTLRDMTKFDFVVLGETPNEEILFGLVGKFWKPAGDLQKVKAEDFLGFDKSGFAKTTWNFTLVKLAPQEICLTTETRVQCLDGLSRSQFGFYWTFIRPFSGWIRREALRLAKEKAESAF